MIPIKTLLKEDAEVWLCTRYILCIKEDYEAESLTKTWLLLTSRTSAPETKYIHIFLKITVLTDKLNYLLYNT